MLPGNVIREMTVARLCYVSREMKLLACLATALPLVFAGARSRSDHSHFTVETTPGTQPELASAWVINADAVVPPHTVLRGELPYALFDHFCGRDTESLSYKDTELAMDLFRHVPSPFMDPRPAAVLVLAGLDPAAIEKWLGSPLLQLELGRISVPGTESPSSALNVIDSVDDVALPKTDRATVAVNVENMSVEDVMKHVHALDSKVLLVASRHAAHEPVTRVTWEGMREGIENVGELVERGMSKLLQRSDDASTVINGTASHGFSSKEDCELATNKCSGHGKCMKSRSGPWFCRCKATTEKGSTTRWGGWDCNKRDVSAGFHLLVWTTVGIGAVMVGAAVLMWGVDSDPLPGILTAAL